MIHFEQKPIKFISEQIFIFWEISEHVDKAAK
jgi:hypothetical protein